MVKKIVSSTPVSIPEVKELLSNKKQELTPLQMRVYNYAASFSKISPEAARKLINELIEQHGLQRDEACQIVNICPNTVEELRTILSGYKRLV
ncbi:MAG: RNA polymerase Rpb4 family protein, partial [Nitrososphaerota archaeon]